MVVERRGGYCFEHNLLLASALDHLGLQVEPMLARVRVGGAPPEARPTGHLVLRVTDGDGKKWQADVGFGLGTLLDPIPFGPDPDTVYEQSGWNFRVVTDGSELVLQTRGPDGWSDVYGFVPRRVPRVDIEVSNWWICTNPRSPFVFGLIASINHDNGRREAISDWSGPLQAMVMTPDGVDSSEQPRTVIPDKLQQFGLAGFQLGDNGRVQRDVSNQLRTRCRSAALTSKQVALDELGSVVHFVTTTTSGTWSLSESNGRPCNPRVKGCVRSNFERRTGCPESRS